jgi:type I restriction enzyme M protein
MLTGELRNQIDSIWNDFWSGGLSNPLQVIEQITYLIFIKRLDEMQELEERKATTLGKPIERRIFPEGEDENGEPYANLRWSRFKHFAGPEMFRIVDKHVFPFIQALNGEDTSYARHMRDARFQIPGPALLAKVVDKLDKLDMGDRDTKGDLYEYMLAKIATAGQNGQFRTPRHLIATMVELVEPKPDDVICDPAVGTCGFLVACGEYLRKHHAALFRDDKLRRHFHEGLFNGFDFDPTMLRIGAMNMALHGVEGANVAYRDSLAEEHAEDAGRYSLVLANPPFAGSLDYESTAKDLLRIVKTKKTELLFLALFLRLLKIGGRRCHCAGWRSVRLVEGPQGLAPHPGGGEQARCGDQAAIGRVPTLCWRLDRDSGVHPHRRRRHRSRVVLRGARGRLVARRQARAASAQR